MRKERIFGLLIILITVCIVGISLGYAMQHEHAEVMKAVAVISPTEGNKARGVVKFMKGGDGMIQVVVDLEGLTPGKHGFHIHEYGDCSAPDATSAGGHFNPEGTPHGAPDAAPDSRHVGDLGNVTANEDGKVQAEFTDSLIAFDGEHSIIGLAVVVHQGEDDLTSQPSGDAGPRVACGAIGIAKE